jgi:cation:H+ antiporter
MVLHDSLIFNTLLVAAGLGMLYFGSEWLVRGSVNIAKKMQVSQLVIGLTIVAFGTSTPELVVSINAALSGQADISLGNVVGSNIANIGLILGLSAAIFPLAVHINTIRREVPIMIGAALALILLSLFDNEITQIEGVLLVLSLIVFVYFSYKQSRKEEERKGKETRVSEFDANERQTMTIEDISPVIETASDPVRHVARKDGKGQPKGSTSIRTPTTDISAPSFVKSISLIAVGLTLLYFGATFTVDNAVVIATAVGISERIVGLTIVAIGTSLPELITSVVAAKKKHLDLSVGNIVGSNIFNVLSIVGISAAIAGVSVNPDIFIDYAVMIAFSLVLIPIMRSGFVISRIEGYGLVAAYSVYLLILLLM